MTEGELKELLEQHGIDNAVVWTGLTEAIEGIAIRCGCPPVVAYDARKVAEVLARDMPPDDVVEWIDVNINGAWVGDSTPVLIYRKEE